MASTYYQGSPVMWQDPRRPGTKSVAGMPGQTQQFTTPVNPGQQGRVGSSFRRQGPNASFGNGGAGGAQGLLDVPGTAEQWYANNKQRWQNPRQLNEYWNGVKGTLSGGKINPQATQGAWAQYGKTMGQPGWGQQNARGVSDQLRNTPGAGEGAGAEAMGYFRQQGAGERYANDNAGYFTQQGAGERFVGSMLPQFGQAGAAELNHARAMSRLKEINYGDQGLGETRSWLQGRAGNTRDFNSGMGDFMQQSPIADEYAYFSGGLRDKSYSEQMFESGTGGLIDPYARAQEKQQKRLRDASAARGFFGSGAGLKAEQELAADIAASEAKDRIALGGQADQARIARTGAAREFVGAIDSSQIGRRQLGLQSATAADDSERGNVAALQDAYKFASDEALQKVGLETSSAQIAQQAAMDRMFRGGQLGLDADRAGMDRMKSGFDMARSGQELGMTRNRDLFATGKGVQDLTEGRLRDSASIGIASDVEERARMNDYFKGAQDMDAAERDAMDQYLRTVQAGSNISSAVDQGDRQQLMDEFDMAKDVQNIFENRERNALGDIMGANSAISQQIFAGLDKAQSERLQLQLQQIEGMLASGKLSADQANQMSQGLFQTAGLGAKAFELWKTSKSGGLGDGTMSPTMF